MSVSSQLLCRATTRSLYHFVALSPTSQFCRGYKGAAIPQNFRKGANSGEYIVEGSQTSKPKRPRRPRSRTKRVEIEEPLPPPVQKGPLPHIGRTPLEQLRTRIVPRQYVKPERKESRWHFTPDKPSTPPRKGTLGRMKHAPGLPEELSVTPSPPPSLFKNPRRFSSPPLLKGFLKSVHEVLGRDALPSNIQALSLTHLMDRPTHIPNEFDDPPKDPTPHWRQALLAAETGSGKSMAYLLPMLQYLKLTEHHPVPLPPNAPPPPSPNLTLKPRGLILAPTHELCRQLSLFAKSLLHIERLRVLCASQANNSSSSRGTNSNASQMKRQLQALDMDMATGLHPALRNKPVDVLVGTPAKILEMEKGWGWDKADRIEDDWDEARKIKAQNWVPSLPEASIQNIEYVVVDEADILFNGDFRKNTRQLLADIARARGYNHPSFADLKPYPGVTNSSPFTSTSPEIIYPFNLILTSATIPASLSTYLKESHPNALRLASENLHRLPSTLETEYYSTSGGNKSADIEKCIRRVWAEELAAGAKTKPKILIFCNKSAAVDDLHIFLQERSIPSIPLTSTGEARHMGSNRHLDGFLKPSASKSKSKPKTLESSPTAAQPDVLITTSLLSRGLDFSPEIRYVLIVDEPLDMIDFIHRAGRSGRAGAKGHVIVFGKTHGRGSEVHKEARKNIRMLVN